jgi:hypothetical protein
VDEDENVHQPGVARVNIDAALAPSVCNLISSVHKWAYCITRHIPFNQGPFGVAMMCDDWSTAGHYIVCLCGSGNGSLWDAMGNLIRCPTMQPTTQSAQVNAEKGEFIDSGKWPQGSQVLVNTPLA